ncbi:MULTISPECIES: SpaH/EbpB family LPXTG-anchored major pilin [unclassified Bifidobacterium]|uniref:SpaH/EbpB family LPXTG-anchored major pilin n=1 Tax=unclassified Bifidobacterium TaxID=2608897 RepID=UPI00112E450D|nr:MULTISPECIES: SpaH/EbpB family LPXTG-anchored major pilin [unclassified Bifidobacterium]TPF77600.1 hypothetical protein BW09_08920 [Bifidobacterium sp. UTCIF-1]TPF79898.1 hypothetical protein BW08_07640 [Bifidobacterium sp. UTCIF-24]TPF81531.1 hypothetical protein BW12_09595 [Bifidobacterium sp. UTCIF-3]TPF84397.1 hypothetical protein BW07_04850 [Bifidobacterium sp. UTCIF-36]TPF88536.1 hypothetical protein BW10_09305 [Bifidobacterium sp. UTBIF-56]
MEMRKLFAGAAALATLLGGLAFGATTASAAPADDAAITVNNAQDGHTYTAYRFATFDNAQGAGGTATSVEVNTEAAWREAVYKAADVANGDAVVPAEYGTPANNDYSGTNAAAYVATFDAATARKFVDELSKNIPAGQTGAVAENGVISVSEGWFLVTDTYQSGNDTTSGKSALVATQIKNGADTFTKLALDKEDGQGDIEVLGVFNAKNENAPTPPEKTVDHTAATVKVGDVLNYTIKAMVPSTASGYGTYAFTITDTASKGLDVTAGDTNPFTVVVKDFDRNGDKTLAAGTDYKLTQTGSAAAADGTTTTIAFPNVKDYAGKTIQVTYKGTVTKDAVDEVTNKAFVKNHNGQTGEGTPVTKKLGKFEFTKIGVGNDAKGLAGAEFNIKDKDGNVLKFSQDTDGTYYPDANGLGTLTSSNGAGTLGKIAVRGLAAGTYTVEETKAPGDYAQNFRATFTVTIGDNGGEGTLNEDTLGLVGTTNKTVRNVKSITQLPLTGAAGTVLFVVVAALLAGSAVTVYAKSRSTKRALTA